jgi:hypothetical protein
MVLHMFVGVIIRVSWGPDVLPSAVHRNNRRPIVVIPLYALNHGRPCSEQVTSP